MWLGCKFDVGELDVMYIANCAIYGGFLHMFLGGYRMGCYMKLWTVAGHSADGVGRRYRVRAT
jgi:hypothetical protein